MEGSKGGKGHELGVGWRGRGGPRGCEAVGVSRRREDVRGGRGRCDWDPTEPVRTPGPLRIRPPSHGSRKDVYPSPLSGGPVTTGVEVDPLPT